MQTKVYGYLKAPDGSTAESLAIRFVLPETGAAQNTIYLEDTEVFVHPDNNGYFEVNLWANSESSLNSPYEVTIFQGAIALDNWLAYIPSGVESISIDEVYSLSKAGTGIPIQFTKVNDALLKSNEALTKANQVIGVVNSAQDALNKANAAINLANSAAAVGIETRNVPDVDIKARIGSGFWQGTNVVKSNGWPKDSQWSHLISSTHDNATNYYALQIASDFFNNEAFYIRSTNGWGETPWNRIITDRDVLPSRMLDGFKWYKAFKINNITGDFNSPGEHTTVNFRIIGQTDYGRTADVQTALIEGSFGIRGPKIRPVLVSRGDLTLGAGSVQYQLRIYEENGDAFLYIRTPVYSTCRIEYLNIGGVALFEDKGTVTYTEGVGWNIPNPSTGNLLWDSANPTNGVQDFYIGNSKVYHTGDFDIAALFNRISELERKVASLESR